MVAVAARSTELRIPRIELPADDLPRVTRWGMLGSVILRAGDRLVPGASRDGLLLLVPRGRGRPMLGLKDRGRLLALPGFVPASDARWRVECPVAAVERQLERGAPSVGPLAVVHGFAALEADADLDGARRAFTDRVMDARELDADCLRATLAPRRFGVSVTIAAAASPDGARALLSGAEAGTLTFVPLTSAPGQVIEGPWIGSAVASPPDASLPASGTAQPRPDLGLRRMAAPRSQPDRQVLLPFRSDTAARSR